MCTDRLGSLDHLLIRNLFISVADIIHYRSGENKAVLHHDSHLLTEGTDGNLGNIDSIN